MSSITTETGIIKNIHDICEYLNQYFVKIGPDLASKMPDQQFDDSLEMSVCGSMFLAPVTEQEVSSIIDGLDSGKAARG